jgi:hypothetical protein
MNIAYLENNGSALYKIAYLEEYAGHKVWHSDDFRDMLSWLVFDPRAEAFGAFLFDLKVSSETLAKIRTKEPYNEEKHYSPSLFFINHYLLINYPNLKNRIILCSAYFDAFTRRGCDLSNYICIDKNEPDIVQQLLNTLSKLEEDYNGHHK